MKRLSRLLTVYMIFLLAATASGKAAFQSNAEMIESAEFIAVVDITEVVKVSLKGVHWTFAQKGTAKVLQVLKGKLPETVSIYGDEDFICARCHLEAGKFLVFLKSDGELLAGNNWQLSVRKITVDKVEWSTEEKLFEKIESPLADVLKEIVAKVSTPNRK